MKVLDMSWRPLPSPFLSIEDLTSLSNHNDRISPAKGVFDYSRVVVILRPDIVNQKLILIDTGGKQNLFGPEPIFMAFQKTILILAPIVESSNDFYTIGLGARTENSIIPVSACSDDPSRFMVRPGIFSSARTSFAKAM